MSTEEREKQIREREAKATKGPWEVLPQDAQWIREGRCDGIIVAIEHTHPPDQSCWDADECPGQEEEYIVQTDGGVYGPDWDTAQFISHARSDIPWLLSQLEELRTDIALRRAGAERLESELASARKWVARLWAIMKCGPSVSTALSEDGELKDILAAAKGGKP